MALILTAGGDGAGWVGVEWAACPGNVASDGRLLPQPFFFFLCLPFLAFLHLLAEATGPVFELAGRASEPPTKAATSAASVILLIITDTPIDSTP
jgi:hypothetical protein